ncbi:hypothetical protein PENTCL1PPCAC_547, partial [Pristionchus entomophagus]
FVMIHLHFWLYALFGALLFHRLAVHCLIADTFSTRMADVKLTEEQLAPFKAGRAAVKANPEIVTASIAKLSPATREVATKIRNLVCSDEPDASKLAITIKGIIDALPEDVKKDYDAYNMEIAKALGLLPKA